jgi:NTE family protein
MEDIPLYHGKRKNILVISGGGLRGFSALGALTRLLELEIIVKPEIYCGTSVGSIICLLMIIGFTPSDIYDILYELDFSTLMISNIDNIFDDVHFGLNKLDPVMYIIGSLMKSKKLRITTTFIDLFKKFNVKLIVTGTCVNDTTLHYFSHELTPDMKILDAIRISISIPIIFIPHIWDGKVWIDGGCMNNYPIELFNDRLSDVIGIYLDENYYNYTSFDDVQTYVKQIMKSLLIGISLNKLEHYKDNTIIIKSTINYVDWNISPNDKFLMYNTGYEFIKNKFG